MRKPRWAYLLMLLVGAGLGVAIAGVPNSRQDPPLRVQTDQTQPTTIAPAPAETTSTTAPPSATTEGRTATTRRR
ncbi:MAG TPA: hypothetical protein VK988_12640 [Acidimicrobiales bacterium]|nr:hypothetical protein [Acidimicrobiales bacterium]